MTLKQFRNKPIVKIISNKYVLVLTTFIIWMVFFDENSLLNHREFNKEIEKLKNEKKYYNSEIAKDDELIKNLDDSDELEKFAREEYKMKKENEEIFIIQYDTLNKK